MTKFEKKLKLLFDAQDFFRNPKLDAIIDEKFDDESVRLLAEDELERLFAAGDPFAADEKGDGGDDKK